MAQQVSLSWTAQHDLRQAARNVGLDGVSQGLLQDISISAWQTSQETRQARRAMESVGSSVEAVADQVEHLERELGVRLEEQTRVLEQQAELLSQVRDAVLTPSKTRAAERVVDAAQLLRKERYGRALTVAEEGIDADPNNPGVFFAAGWALLGLERPDDARKMFEEAREAADGDEQSRAARQAARSALAGGNLPLAYSLVRDARAMAVSDEERAAVAFDVSVYAWLNGDRDTAKEVLESACRYDSRYCHMTLIDRNLIDAQELHELASVVLTELAEQVVLRQERVRTKLDEVRAELPRPPNSALTHDQLGAGVRPPQDWRSLKTGIDGRVSRATADSTASGKAETLQHSSRLLIDSATILEEAHREIPKLRSAISAHDEAAAQHARLEDDLSQVERERQRVAGIVNVISGIRRKTKLLIFWGIVLCLVGLAWAPLQVVGAIMIICAVIVALVAPLLEAERDKRARDSQRIAQQIRR